VFTNKQCSLVSDLVKNVSLLMSIFVSTGCILTYTFMIVFKVFKLDHKEQIVQLMFFNLCTFYSVFLFVNRLRMMMALNSATQPVFIVDLMISVTMFRLIGLIHIYF